MRPAEFVSSLQGLKFENVFNPYSDRCAVHDLEDAPSRRSKALLDLLETAAATEIDALWIGRDLGHRGGRRTGLALTDDVHVTIHRDALEYIHREGDNGINGGGAHRGGHLEHACIGSRCRFSLERVSASSSRTRRPI